MVVKITENWRSSSAPSDTQNKKVNHTTNCYQRVRGSASLPRFGGVFELGSGGFAGRREARSASTTCCRNEEIGRLVCLAALRISAKVVGDVWKR
jgi:hypothetical protein